MFDLKEKNVLIIGDCGVDHYVIGDVTRLSPEAPVPVLTKIQEEFRLGLAANVANNVRALGSDPTLISVIGPDSSALAPLFGISGIRAKLVTDPFRKTTTKTRVMAGQTQLVRIDEESTDPLNSAIEDEIISHIRYEMARTDIVIIQDYGKGVITQKIMDAVVALAEKYDLGVLVDPYSKRDPHLYVGADILTPNKQECMELVSSMKPKSVEQASNYLLGATGAWGILTTLGKDGMYGAYKFALSFSLKSEAQNVVDVTGAGDTVISALAIGMAMGLDFQNAASMANHAAGIVVKKLGTSVCTKEELLRSLKERK